MFFSLGSFFGFLLPTVLLFCFSAWVFISFFASLLFGLIICCSAPLFFPLFCFSASLLLRFYQVFSLLFWFFASLVFCFFCYSVLLLFCFPIFFASPLFLFLCFLLSALYLFAFLLSLLFVSLFASSLSCLITSAATATLRTAPAAQITRVANTKGTRKAPPSWSCTSWTDLFVSIAAKLLQPRHLRCGRI